MYSTTDDEAPKNELNITEENWAITMDILRFVFK